MVWNWLYFIDDIVIETLSLILNMTKTHQMAPPFKNLKKSTKINDISTTHPCLRMLWVSKEAELKGGFKIFGLVRCFSVKTKKSSKTSKIEPKTWKKRHFWAFFQHLCNFDWKTAHQIKKFEFLEVFHFFWHPVCPQ